MPITDEEENQYTDNYFSIDVFVYVCNLCQISAILSCLVASSVGLYTSSDDVIELTQTNFNTRVLQSDQLWMVEFYAPWYNNNNFITIMSSSIYVFGFVLALGS